MFEIIGMITVGAMAVIGALIVFEWLVGQFINRKELYRAYWEYLKRSENNDR